MLKKLVKNIVLKMFPELSSNMHVAQLALVVAIVNPPTEGGVCTEISPMYAVDCKLLKNDLSIDLSMPILRDIPVSLYGAGNNRGLAMLPQVGSIVEIAFAFGLQTHPFIRCVLPYNQMLPKIDHSTIKLQQNNDSFAEIKQNEASIVTPKIWIGNKDENLLQILSEFLSTTKQALYALSSHTHGEAPPNISTQLTQTATTIQSQKDRIDNIKKIKFQKK